MAFEHRMAFGKNIDRKNMRFVEYFNITEFLSCDVMCLSLNKVLLCERVWIQIYSRL